MKPLASTLSIPPEHTEIKKMQQPADKSLKEERLKGACAQFESIFIQQLLKTMRESIPKSSLFDGGLSENIYTSMFDQEVSKKMAEGKGMGLAKGLYKQLAEDRMKAIPRGRVLDNE